MKTETENTSGPLIMKKKKREESEQMTETRMEETTSPLPSRIRDQLIGAERDTPANMQLKNLIVG